MSPTAGIGATSALRDAAMLAEVVRNEGVSKESVGRYEAFMRESAREGIQRSALGGRHLFGMRGWEELGGWVGRWGRWKGGGSRFRRCVC